MWPCAACVLCAIAPYDVLFILILVIVSASALIFQEALESSRKRSDINLVVPAQAGTHDHRPVSWVPALAALGRDDGEWGGRPMASLPPIVISRGIARLPEQAQA
jgi:hypothetical protein